MSDSQDGFQWNDLDEDEVEEEDSSPFGDISSDGDEEEQELDSQETESDETDDTRIAELEEQLAEKDAIIEEKDETIDQLNKTVSEQKTDIESLKATIDSLKQEKESLEKSIDKLNTAQANAEKVDQPEAPESVQDDLLEVLEMLEHEVDGAVPYNRLIATAKNSGLPADALDPALDTLMRKGDIVEPFNKQYERYDP